MSDSEVKPDANTSVSYDIFFRGSEGYGEHFQVRADDSQPIIQGRPKLIEWLKMIGAKPLPRDMEFERRPSAARPPTAPAAAQPADPMLAAAQQVLGAGVGKTCPEHGTAMRRIAGTAETGKVGPSGRAYNAFWVCDVQGCKSR